MSMQDPIADMLTRIRNAQMAQLQHVSMPASNVKRALASVLQDEGYIADFDVAGDSKPVLRINLKYYQGKAVIEKIRRISRPGLRVYCRADEMPRIKNGFGVGIVSTPQGMMSCAQAKAKGLGGELIAEIE
jgi:small subunit ribosomal protein S8